MIFSTETSVDEALLVKVSTLKKIASNLYNIINSCMQSRERACQNLILVRRVEIYDYHIYGKEITSVSDS